MYAPDKNTYSAFVTDYNVGCMASISNLSSITLQDLAKLWHHVISHV